MQSGAVVENKEAFMPNELIIEGKNIKHLLQQVKSGEELNLGERFTLLRGGYINDDGSLTDRGRDIMQSAE
jgi:hypothetical protein